MDGMRPTSRALQQVTGAVKVNVDIHGNMLPHQHAHYFPQGRGRLLRGRAHRPPPLGGHQGVHL